MLIILIIGVSIIVILLIVGLILSTYVSMLEAKVINLEEKKKEVNDFYSSDTNKFMSYLNQIKSILKEIESNKYKDQSTILYSDLANNFNKIVEYIYNVHRQDLDNELYTEIEKMLKLQLEEYREALEVVKNIEEKVKSENIEISRTELREFCNSIKNKEKYQNELIN